MSGSKSGSKQKSPPRREGNGSLSLGFVDIRDLDDLGGQARETALDLFVRELLDSDFLCDFQFLLGVDVALVGVAEGVLQKELSTFGGAFVLIQTLCCIRFNTLERVVDSPSSR